MNLTEGVLFMTDQGLGLSTDPQDDDDDNDLENELEDELEDDQDDELEDDLGECPRDLFPFKGPEQELIQGIIAEIRSILARCEPVAIERLAKILFALERLPWKTEGINCDLIFRLEAEAGITYVRHLEISEGSFSLYEAMNFYVNNILESDGQILFQVETGGFRDGTTDNFSNWLCFETKGCSIEVSDNIGDPIPDLPQVSEDGWKRLKAYWDLNEDLEDE